MKIQEIKPNPNNPRIIKDYKFKQLVKSIQDFPQMLELRPIVIDENNMVLGGNMRLKACKEAGLTDVPVIHANNLSEEKKKEFIVKDNVGFGEWDWDLLANEFDTEEIGEWGVDLPLFGSEKPIDYSILDEQDVSDTISDMNSNVRKAVQIEYELEYYEEAFEIIKWWRERGGNVGMMLLEHLKEEKSKL
jgi:hypothetical protein